MGSLLEAVQYWKGRGALGPIARVTALRVKTKIPFLSRQERRILGDPLRSHL